MGDTDLLSLERFHVKELARASGISADTVRYYAEIGLLRPWRDPLNGYRLFSASDVTRASFIRRAKRLGYTLKEIRQIFEESAKTRGPKACMTASVTTNKPRQKTRCKRTDPRAAAGPAPKSGEAPVAGSKSVPGAFFPGDAASDLWRYQIDFWQRSVLFLDTLRERAEQMLAHERAGLPPVLNFQYETILDARTSARPANYALLRITAAGEACVEACVKEGNRPVIVVDPRAGHGPWIGGFKRDSEVGIALYEGHPVYFVSFFPEPCPGQTLADVLSALYQFVQEVGRRHPNAKAPAL